ncbi:hypothetical protein LXL04_036897 [Taraxacum kok-saghyz]
MEMAHRVARVAESSEPDRIVGDWFRIFSDFKQFYTVGDLIKYAAVWGNCPKKRKVFLAILYGYLWCVWKARNEMYFHKIRTSKAKMADNITTTVFEWVKHRGNYMNCNWANWICCPFNILPVFICQRSSMKSVSLPLDVRTCTCNLLFTFFLWILGIVVLGKALRSSTGCPSSILDMDNPPHPIPPVATTAPCRPPLTGNHHWSSCNRNPSTSSSHVIAVGHSQHNHLNPTKNSKSATPPQHPQGQRQEHLPKEQLAGQHNKPQKTRQGQDRPKAQPHTRRTETGAKGLHKQARNGQQETSKRTPHQKTEHKSNQLRPFQNEGTKTPPQALAAKQKQVQEGPQQGQNRQKHKEPKNEQQKGDPETPSKSRPPKAA